MDWKSFILSSLPVDAITTFEMTAPAENQQLDVLKKTLALEVLPPELEELYRQTNGIVEVIDSQEIGDLIWNTERAMAEYGTQELLAGNTNTLFDRLFFFADAGNGDLFGFGAFENRFINEHVYVWDHEDGSVTLLAPDLKTFLKGWINGTIKL